MTLLEKASKWQQALKDGDTGPLVIAKQIVSLSEKWDSFKSEAEDQSCTQWLRATLGKDLAWFVRRAAAVEKLGEDVRRWMNHEAAVWLAHSVQDDGKISKVMPALRKSFEANGKNPLSLGQTMERVKDILDWQPKPKAGKVCERCKELEAELAQLRAGMVQAAE